MNILDFFLKIGFLLIFRLIYRFQRSSKRISLNYFFIFVWILLNFGWIIQISTKIGKKQLQMLVNCQKMQQSIAALNTKSTTHWKNFKLVQINWEWRALVVIIQLRFGLFFSSLLMIDDCCLVECMAHFHSTWFQLEIYKWLSSQHQRTNYFLIKRTSKWNHQPKVLVANMRSRAKQTWYWAS